jgi:CheY-like chemotaxis protein
MLPAGAIMAKSVATVLVVDDDEQVLRTTADLLASLGCKVITTPHGRMAHVILQRNPSIDLLLTDILLAGSMDGLELARLAEEMNPAIAIVYSTTYSPMFLLDSEAPRDRLLVRKPWRRGQLEAALSSALPLRHHAASCVEKVSSAEAPGLSASVEA